MLVPQPRASVNLSDFLTRADGRNNHVQRGPFEYSVMRIGKKSRRGGQWQDRGTQPSDKVGVFLYCQQHAREWATPLTCLEHRLYGPAKLIQFVITHIAKWDSTKAKRASIFGCSTFIPLSRNRAALDRLALGVVKDRGSQFVALT